jgi:hypothetical protein
MGNSASSIKENTNDVTEFLLKIDKLAASYITSSNISTSNKISDLQFCDDLVIMTSDVLSNNLTAMDIDYLHQRTEKGVVIDDMTTDKVIFFKKGQKDNLDIKNNTKKRRICNGISKFYIKIAQLYAAILKTINPVYKYKDEYGKYHNVPISEKSRLPTNSHYTLTQINLCNRRLNALLNGQDYTKEDNKDVFVHPDICAVNIKDGKSMSLLHEEGMVEFGELFKDEFNFDLGRFDKMSKKMKEEYKKALSKFYNAYTGDDSGLPESIKKFSDIKLRQFSTIECSKDGKYTKKYKGTMSEELFEKYAFHMRDMYITLNKKQNDIVNILKDVFSIIDTGSGEKVIINPKLVYKTLDEIIIKTQNLITDLYVKCEEDFLKGLSIFQEIILYHNMKANELRRENIKKDFESTLTGENMQKEPQPIPEETKLIDGNVNVTI